MPTRTNTAKDESQQDTLLEGKTPDNQTSFWLETSCHQKKKGLGIEGPVCWDRPSKASLLPEEQPAFPGTAPREWEHLSFQRGSVAKASKQKAPCLQPTAPQHIPTAAGDGVVQPIQGVPAKSRLHGWAVPLWAVLQSSSCFLVSSQLLHSWQGPGKFWGKGFMWKQCQRGRSQTSKHSVGNKIIINRTDQAQLHHKLQVAHYSSFSTMEKINHQLQDSPSASHPSHNFCEFLKSSCLKGAHPSGSRCCESAPALTDVISPQVLLSRATAPAPAQRQHKAPSELSASAARRKKNCWSHPTCQAG